MRAQKEATATRHIAQKLRLQLDESGHLDWLTRAAVLMRVPSDGLVGPSAPFA
ncbi:MAG: hypothetical protein ACK473_01335 [Sphingomonadales bacterium]